MAIDFNDKMMDASEGPSVILAQGIPGQTPSFSIGEVDSVSPDAGAEVEMTGTLANPILNFKIPRGVSGSESINDNAGEGDTDFTWSANKLTEQFSRAMRIVARGSITDSKLLPSPGFYNVNSSWYTDLTEDFGSGVIGILQDWSNPGSQRIQVFITEYGMVSSRWVKSDGTSAGPWQTVNLNNLMKFNTRGSITDSKLLPSPSFYNVNTSWFTDLTEDFGSGVIGILQSWSESGYQKYQIFTAENGLIAYRVVSGAGVVVLDWKIIRNKRQFYYAAFGDSRCYGYTANTGALNPYRYPKYIGDKLNIGYGNFGLSGSGLFARPSRDLPDALSVVQDNASSLLNNNVNLITIEYGVNDWEHPIGSYTDTGDDTWCGKLYKLTKYISETFPKAHLIVIGSANTAEGTQETDYGYGYTTQSGWSLGGLIREEAKLLEKYHIPFISGFDSPLNNFNIADLMPDQLHFDDDGYLMRSRYLLGKIGSFVNLQN